MPSDAPISSSPPAQTAPEAERSRDAGLEPADGDEQGEPSAMDSPEQDVLTLDPDDDQPHPTASPPPPP